MVTISPVAYFRSPFKAKFGIPRQSGVVGELRGQVVFEQPYRREEAVRGIEGFDYLWLIWGFSASDGGPQRLTVRPPRLGGNRRMGVFATRSPFRPNGLGLSAVRLDSVNLTADRGPVLCVSGADLMDGTPIYDIKPYISFSDSHGKARSGFVDDEQWQMLRVEYESGMLDGMDESDAHALVAVLAQDPRPHYHDAPGRIYGMSFGSWNVRFTVDGDLLRIVGVESL